MPINRVEAVVDALFKLNGGMNPESECYRLRNPLMLKSFAPLGKHEIDDSGLRIFNSFLAGYKAACFDCDLKIRGKSRAGLKPTDPLSALLGVYGISSKQPQETVLSFLRRALNDQEISLKTNLSYFIS